MDTSLSPIRLYGSSASYFTGKMENYFRVRGVPYTQEIMYFPESVKQNIANLGVAQMPTVQLGDGRWMTDTTAMIQWFETQIPEHRIIPDDPAQRFLCLLLEDYADEWLWRPAMHYRWYYPKGAYLLSRHLVDELVRNLPLPRVLLRWNLRRRQRGGYTAGDGVGPEAVAGTEAIYGRTLEQLEHIFSQRDFLLGSKPSLADIGFSGPFFRHFAFDPIPLEILRQQAPATLAWVARLWAYAPSKGGEWVEGIPNDIGPILDEIGRAYLPYLNANVDAVAAGKKTFDATIDNVPYRGARYSRYRVWCLAQLRAELEAIAAPARSQVEELLNRHGCLDPLYARSELPLLPDQEAGLPFNGSTKMVGVNE